MVRLLINRLLPFFWCGDDGDDIDPGPSFLGVVRGLLLRDEDE